MLNTDSWSTAKDIVKPTQPSVGTAWIQYKAEKDFSTKADAQTEMDAAPTPAVLGTDYETGGDFIYIVDDHHTFCALDWSGFSSVLVT